MNFVARTRAKCIHFVVAPRPRALFKRNVIIHIRTGRSRLFVYPLTVNNFIASPLRLSTFEDVFAK